MFKFFKCVALIAMSAGIFHLLHKDVGMAAEHWVRALHLDPGNRYVDLALMKVSRLSPAQIKKLGLGTLLYAGLFLTEGIGLWLKRRWGEWLTVVITSTLIPVELYEIWRHPGATKVVAFVINVTIVGYLVWRIRSEPGRGRA